MDIKKTCRNLHIKHIIQPFTPFTYFVTLYNKKIVRKKNM